MSSSPVQVILLNGVSSVGKSSAAKALQRIAARPLLHVSMDAFLDMLPTRTLNHPDGITFETLHDGERPETAVRTGEVVERMLRGMRHAIAALAAQGNHLVVDDVMFDAAAEAEYRALLREVDFRMVGLHAPLDVVEARELDRGDREVGLARWQQPRVHRGRRYDLEIDTSRLSPDAAAMRIKKAFGV